MCLFVSKSYIFMFIFTNFEKYVYINKSSNSKIFNSLLKIINLKFKKVD